MGHLNSFDLFFLFLGICMIIGAAIVGLMTLGYSIEFAPIILFAIAMCISMVAVVVILTGYVKQREEQED
ncbi:MAG: hypothetical protein D5R99_01115 [Methanocalculus sp. MSAO_Arc1]|uniref:hypothetical protein n=1 Tax=Methanocalculus TaxID=71151 RepID=UPI000FEFCD56|nr:MULTISPECIES: hypothetical protein [unclassified Methanocalculus]MCP1663087.1 putative membrane protein [Methanocalculus sp. AMF5]RQD81759.1 MAG: hypothetical protein D5R99_01115 [Methanocalculus sp. MSAO_Arc1]